MLKEQPKSKKSFGLPSGGPAKLFILIVGVLVIILGVVLVFGGGTSNSTQVVNLMAQAQEVTRVSNLEDPHFNSQNIKDISATVQETIGSQQTQFGLYLAKIKIKYSTKQLALKTNKATDVQLQTAAQNNNLEGAYLAYLQSYITSYQNSLKFAYQNTKSRTLKSALQGAYTSNQTLLKSPLFTQT